MNLTFANPYLLFLLLLLVPMIWWYIKGGHHARPHLRVSSTALFANVRRTYKYYLWHVPFVLRCLVIALLIVVLARPQSSFSERNVSSEGIDIMITIDVSFSMLSRDFEPNRLEEAKKQAIEFINKRQTDRLGLVVFSGESFTQCPLTTDRAVVINMVNGIKTGVLADGTAIGMGLASAVNRLKDSDSKSKVVILLTDGVNNQGNITPITAAELAQQFGIKVYTIGVGSRGQALSPVGRYPDGSFAFDYAPVEIDEELLQKVADMTGGKYFRADTKDKLADIYREIDRLEKSKIEVTEFSEKEEEYLIFAIIAGVLLLLEVLLRHTVLRTIP